MLIRQTTANLRLRGDAGLAKETIGEINQGQLCYVLNGPVMADDLPWYQIGAVCLDGAWRVGWSAGAYGGDTLLAPYTPAVHVGSPVRQPMYVSQMFGENPDVYGRFGYLGHNGIDLATPVGTPILAIDAGVASHAKNDPTGYGNYVRIDHEWGISLYGHLSQLHVQPWQSVNRGQVIGLSGNSGMSTGPHLHFEVRLHPVNDGNGYGGRVDPVPFVALEYLRWPEYLPAELREKLA